MSFLMLEKEQVYMDVYTYIYICIYVLNFKHDLLRMRMRGSAPSDDGERSGGLGSRPKKMYGERLGDGVEYHLMKPTPRR